MVTEEVDVMWELPVVAVRKKNEAEELVKLSDIDGGTGDRIVSWTHERKKRPKA